MIDNRPTETERSQGNLGQNMAKQEKTSHEKLDHMSGDQKSRAPDKQPDKQKERKGQKKSR